MSKTVLDLSESSDEDLNQFNINSDFAKNYDNWRRKEEIQKLKDKYGTHLDVLSDSDHSFISGSDDDSDSDTESDQSVGEEQQVFDDNFFKVYSALKTKNPIIYEKDVKFFDETKNETQIKDNSTKTKDKTMSLQEYHKKLIKEKKGMTEEDIQQMNGFEDKPIGYYEELDEIRNEFKSVLNSNGYESDDQLIKGKAETVSAVKHQTLEFLDEDKDQNKDSDLKYLKNYWKNSNDLEESERFLRDYILNKRYVNQRDEELYKKPEFSQSFNSDNESNDNRNGNEVIEAFVTIDDMNKDNEIEPKISKFHFEEPNSVAIKRFPRNVETIRDSTNGEKRSQKRSETKERKKREKDRELKRLRQLKKEELKQRLKKMQEISGNDGIDLDDLDLNTLLDDENDFDSEKYDQKMQSLFGNNYYENENQTKSKPKFEYMPEIDDYNEDIDNNDNELNDNIKTKGKNSKKLDKKKKKIEKELSEIGIFEDLIGGDLATRYKYRTVESNDFGLTNEEILYSDDKELNNWCSIKKMSQYRDVVEEKYDIKSYANKAQNLSQKQKILKTFYEKQNENQLNEETNCELNSDKKRKKRKHKKPQFVIQPIGGHNKSSDQKKDEKKDDNNSDNNVSKTNNNSNKRSKKHRNKRQKTNDSENPYPGVSVDRLKAYGLSNRKIKKINHKNKK